MNISEILDSKDAFEAVFDADLKQKLIALEIKRKSALRTVWSGGGVAVFAFIAGAVLFNSPVFMFLGVLTIAWGFRSLYENVSKQRTEAKHLVMSHLCEKLNFKYSPNADKKAFSTFKHLRMLPGYDQRILEDEISGEIDGVGFTLFEAKLFAETDNNSYNFDIESLKITKGEKIFNGLLFLFDFHKTFKGTTVVGSDKMFMGSFLSRNKFQGERVKLESASFERMFTAYSTDQIEARYLLTPTMMEKLVKIAKFAGSKRVELAFHENKLLMVLENDKDYFEGEWFEIDNPMYIKTTLKELAFILNFARRLELDRKTKV